MAGSTVGYDRVGRQLVVAFVEQLFRDGIAIEDIWAMNDLGFSPYGEDDESPCFTLTLREIDACRDRARRGAE